LHGDGGCGIFLVIEGPGVRRFLTSVRIDPGAGKGAIGGGSPLRKMSPDVQFTDQ